MVVGQGGRNVVYVVGTGTIGEPLIGLFAKMRQPLGVEDVYFHKNTARLVDRPRVNSLIGAGAHLVAGADNIHDMERLGHHVTCDAEEALSRASVVVDCTPKGVGRANKRELYESRQDRISGFIAQGSERGFGKMYASGINDAELRVGRDKFVQVVSCNTHNIAVMLDSLGDPKREDLGVESAEFVCLRRANDLSQDGKFVPAPEVGDHDDDVFGTHHARDAHMLFQTRGHKLRLFSSAVKLNTQLMHALWFRIRLGRSIDKQEVLRRLHENPRVALTQKRTANTVFSFGREHGYYGRILNQTVVSVPTVHVRENREVLGFCFTPQDGNSLLSSISATLWLLDPGKAEQRLQCLSPYIYKEV